MKKLLSAGNLWVVIRSVLAFLGFLAVARYSLVAFIEFSGEDSESPGDHIYVSPDGQYKAVHFYYVSGGVVDLSCVDEVAVFNSAVSMEQAQKNKQYQVFSSPCDNFSDHRSSPDIIWTSNRELKIEFSLSGTALFSRKVVLRAHDATGVVTVNFFAHK